MKGPTWVGLVRTASEKGITIAIAESCTGGYISSKLTDVPGASKCFIGAFVVYSNDLKMGGLRISPATLKEHGAVSRETSREMAERCREISKADISLSVTGIAGPSGGSPDKPIGTVFITVVSDRGAVLTEGFDLGPLKRVQFKKAVSERALGMLMGALR